MLEQSGKENGKSQETNVETTGDQREHHKKGNQETKCKTAGHNAENQPEKPHKRNTTQKKLKKNKITDNLGKPKRKHTKQMNPAETKTENHGRPKGTSPNKNKKTNP